MASRPHAFSSSVQNVPPAKRARVALACERCKSRKQKCDGRHPECSKCHRLGIKCEYIIPSKPMPFGRNHYVSALEKRVVELERFLAKKGLLNQVPSFKPYNLSQPSSVAQESEQADIDIEPSSKSPKASSIGETDLRSSDNESAESMVRILRDLSLDTNGGYIGATSHITLGRLVGSIVKGKRQSVGEGHSPSQVLYQLGSEGSHGLHLSDVPPDMANKLFHGYMKHVATRYPALQSSWIYGLQSRRAHIDNAYDRSTLHLIYAIAGRFLETTGETGPNFCPSQHHAEALKQLDEVLSYHDTRSVVTLLLLAIYSLRAEGGPGAWAYIGFAMRIAIDLGLHRQTAAMNRLGFDVEMRKRLFWSCYTMDRQISIPLGRPFSISDRDIDVPLPLDVDESCQDIRALEIASTLEPDVPRKESTTLTAFLHILRLRRIESNIQQSIYRVDEAVNVTDDEVDYYLEQLEKWKNLIPLDAKGQYDRESVAFDGYDYYMVFYYKCQRLLLYPLISKPRPKPKYLKACARVCGGVAQTYKRLHQTLSVGYSLMALQTVFMAGLTLVYCAWISPSDVYSSIVSNDINACSIVLFVITERWPAARKYRDTFEAVKQIVIDPLSDDQNHKPQRVIMELPSIELPLDEGRQEYRSIVTHMSGRPEEAIQSSKENTAIGMEQVQYQMGICVDNVNELGSTQNFELYGPLNTAPLSDYGIPRCLDHNGAANDQVYHDLSVWVQNNMEDDVDPSTSLEPFDLEGCSIEMGWFNATVE
ncbi:hypothetical protein M433DRAFT_139318 [Acidomyces richmondensis BFW]|nr:hypothetical protein M433DRAFT_139318 [Acidomyces richmondensis BFW]